MWNPLNWIKLISTIRAGIDLARLVFESLRSAVRWVSAWWTKRSQRKEIEEIKKAEDQIAQANEIEDDEKRLREKANAACKLEQAFDPDRKC